MTFGSEKCSELPDLVQSFQQTVHSIQNAEKESSTIIYHPACPIQLASKPRQLPFIGSAPNVSSQKLEPTKILIFVPNLESIA